MVFHRNPCVPQILPPLSIICTFQAQVAQKINVGVSAMEELHARSGTILTPGLPFIGCVYKMNAIHENLAPKTVIGVMTIKIQVSRIKVCAEYFHH